jgi:hypothetical protein
VDEQEKITEELQRKADRLSAGLDCPFCGKGFSVFVGGPCGSEQDGYVSVNHNCDSGLDIEYFEHGQDVEKAIAALSKRAN